MSGNFKDGILLFKTVLAEKRRHLINKDKTQPKDIPCHEFIQEGKRSRASQWFRVRARIVGLIG